MARKVSFAVAALILSTTPGASVFGFWWGSTNAQCGDPCACRQQRGNAALDRCKMVTGINQRWPSPYVCPDRVNAHAPFNAMISNGWRRQNLMGSHHFNENSSKLTQAGELKVHWIMTQAPIAYRRVFVERSLDQAVTDRRMLAIREFSERIAKNDTVPQVTETHIVSEGRPAATVNFVNNQYRDNMRPPVLPTGGGASGDE